MKAVTAVLVVIASFALAVPTYAVERGDSGADVTEVQTILKGFGYTIVVDGVFGPQTEKAVRSWQKSNGLKVDGIAGPATLASLRGATRIGNTTQVTGGLNGLPFAPPGLSDCDEMKFYRQQAGLPERFDALAYRESRCRNEESVKTWCCHGYWQLHQQHVKSGYAKRWREECGITSYTDFNSDDPLEKQKQACGAFVLYDMSGLSPWAL